MLTTVSLFFLGAVLAFADNLPDCETKSDYRELLFTNIRAVNESLEWSCELEKRAYNNEEPTGNSFKVVVNSGDIPDMIGPDLFVEHYPWYLEPVAEAEEFGCNLRKENSTEPGFYYLNILCHFSY